MPGADPLDPAHAGEEADALAGGAVGAGVYTADTSGRLVTVNDEALRLLARTRGELVGRNMHELVHYQDETGAPLPLDVCPLIGVTRTGVPARTDDDVFWRSDGTPLHVAWLSAPLRDGERIAGAVVVFVDAATPVVRDQRFVSTGAGSSGDGDVLQAARDRLVVLGRVSDALSTLDPDEALRRLARISVGRSADACVVHSVDGGVLRRVALARRDGGEEQSRARALPPPTPASHGSLAQVLAGSGQRVVHGAEPLPDDDPLDAVQSGLLRELGTAHALVTPLVARHEVLGAMTWVRTDPDDPFTEPDAFLAAEVARRAGLALENGRLFRQQRRVAESLQRNLLTVSAEPDHLQIAARYLPATDGAEVGGDWYDSFLLPDGATALVIGDVVGHDLQAAALMGQLRNMLRAIGFDRGESPAEVLTRLDAALAGLRVDALATCVLARIEQDDAEAVRGLRRLRWSSAGHPPPVLVQADGTARLLDSAPDLLLGVDPTTHRSEVTTELHPGSTLWLYTDGLVERSDSPLELGLARLRQVLGAVADLPLEQAADELLARMLPDGHPDDVALLALRAHPESAPLPPKTAPIEPAPVA